MIITKIEYGNGFVRTVGELSYHNPDEPTKVIAITEYQAERNDVPFYRVCFENGEEQRIYNPNIVYLK